MVESSHRVKVDMAGFIEDSKKLLNEDWPLAVATALKVVATRTEHMERVNTRETFKLHSQWIPNNIRAFPRTANQALKIKSDIQRKHEAFASVSTSDNIEYMSMQEDGATKRPQGSALAIAPWYSRQRYGMLNRMGKTKDKFQPGALLEAYNKKNWGKGTTHKGERGTGTKQPFIIMGKGGKLLLVQRRTKKSRPLKTLYVFTDDAKIKPIWHFEERGYNFIKTNYDRIFTNVLQAMVLTKYGG